MWTAILQGMMFSPRETAAQEQQLPPQKALLDVALDKSKGLL